jgi:protein subunit release factor B
MSELTPCNRCSLNRITRDAEKRGATVEVKRALLGQTMEGWYGVYVSDRGTEAIGWMQEITQGCAC